MGRKFSRTPIMPPDNFKEQLEQTKNYLLNKMQEITFKRSETFYNGEFRYMQRHQET